ncbi:hypothetical protein ACF0H5_010290 [Mactra antiquata]
MPAFLANISKSGDVAERSPAVISANLKEDMLLQKKLVVLNRSEQSIVHQIKVDQKVMYRRFQAKLSCSKLAYARLMGQRQLQRQLREKNIGRLNTDIVGNTDEDFAFLDKLEQRPCTADSFSPRLPDLAKTPKKTKRKASQQNESLEKKINESLPEVNIGRSSSARARFVGEEKENEKVDKVEPVVKSNIVRRAARPATTLGTRVDEEYLRNQQAKEKLEAETNEQQDVEKRVEFKEPSEGHSEHTAAESHEDGNENNKNQENCDTDEKNDKPNVAFLEHLDAEEVRPNTVGNFPCADPECPTPLSPSSPRQLSRRASRVSDFFHAEEKVDPIILRLKAAKSVDFTEEVSKFCAELEELKGARNGPNVDYYASRLAASMRESNTPLCEVPGTPDDENTRCVGNLFVRSLTVPELNWNFTEKQ